MTENRGQQRERGPRCPRPVQPAGNSNDGGHKQPTARRVRALLTRRSNATKASNPNMKTMSGFYALNETPPTGYDVTARPDRPSKDFRPNINTTRLGPARRVFPLQARLPIPAPSESKLEVHLRPDAEGVGFAGDGYERAGAGGGGRRGGRLTPGVDVV